MASVLDLIGQTPLIEVTRIDRGLCRLFLKLESANPSGSLKDRPARTMIEAAEADGKLAPGGTIAEAIARRTPGAFFINQFANPANPQAHAASTGPEILRQMEHDVDAVVVGVGSGGALTGIGRFMRQASPKTAMVLADPAGSVLAPYVQTGKMSEAGSWAVEGIGEDFIPPNCDLT